MIGAVVDGAAVARLVRITEVDLCVPERGEPSRVRARQPVASVGVGDDEPNSAPIDAERVVFEGSVVGAVVSATVVAVALLATGSAS
jgi:hypothetical protein